MENNAPQEGQSGGFNTKIDAGKNYETKIEAAVTKIDAAGTKMDPAVTRIDAAAQNEAAPSPEGEKPARHRHVRAGQRTTTIRDRKADMRNIAIMLAIFFLAFLILIRYVISINKPTQGKAESHEDNGLYMALRTEQLGSRSATQGMQLSVFNMTGHAVPLEFAKTGPKFDFIVQKQVNFLFTKVPVEVWRYSNKNTKFSEIKGDSLTIMPNEEMIFRAEWDKTDNEGNKVSPGKYMITGFINTAGGTRSLELNTGN